MCKHEDVFYKEVCGYYHKSYRATSSNPTSIESRLIMVLGYYMEGTRIPVVGLVAKLAGPAFVIAKLVKHVS